MKQFKAQEIVALLKQEIQSYQPTLVMEQVGKVIEVGDGIAWVYGLQNAMAGEMLEFENGEIAQVFNLEENYVGTIILGDYLKIKEGESVRSTGKLMSVPVGKDILGRVINPVGQPKDDGPTIVPEKYYPLERIAPGIADRQPVFESLQTGLKSIDAMIPIGRGQRELIIGDRKTGKTAIAIDTIINQKDQDVICVYVAIGQKESTVAAIKDTLQRHGAMGYTIIIDASSSETATLQYIAPYAGCAIAEYFMYEHNRHTLVIYDDLSKHAAAYRQLSLLLRRPPGREAYPGDIFYLHSRLLERSIKLSKERGGGSLTALPIIETQEGEVSAYIPTNVISITDGQIYLTPELFFSGIRPAVDVGISVSRVGGKAQTKAMQAVAKNLRLELANYRELEAFAQLGTELDKTTEIQLERDRRLVEILKQDQYHPMPVAEQVAVIFVGIEGYLDKISCSQISQFEKEFLEYLKIHHTEYHKIIASTRNLTPEAKEILKQAIEAFLPGFIAKSQDKKS